MTEKTKQLLSECKKAGYKRVAVLVRDKRVPRSKTIESGAWFGDKPQPEDLPNTPINVICACPEQINEEGNPKMWDIVKNCGLAVGLDFGGQGMGDAHNIYPPFRETLTSGYYDLGATQCQP